MARRLFLSAGEIRSIRRKVEKYPWAKRIYKRLGRWPRRLSDETVAHPVWSDGHRVRDKALIYAVSGDNRPVDDVVRALRSAFELDDMSKPLDGVQGWGYGLFRAMYVWAFDLVREHRSVRGELERRLETRFAEALEAQKRAIEPDWEYCYNTRFWHVCTIGLLGFLLDDDEAVSLAIDGKWGFKTALENLADGCFWPEATVYGHHYVGCCMTILAEVSRHTGGEDLYAYSSPSGHSIKSLHDGPVKLLLADGRVATHGDNSSQAAVVSEKERGTGHDIGDTFLFDNRSFRETNRYEILYRAYRDPVYAWLLSQNPARDHWDHTFWGYAALTHGVPLGRKTPPSAVSSVFAEYGCAVVRSDESAGYWRSDAPAVFVRNGCAQPHGHRDPFHLTLHAFGKTIYPDWFIQWDYCRGRFTRGKPDPKKPYSKSILAHNTTIVDAKEPPAQASVAFVDLQRQGAMQVLRAEGEVYPGVRQSRTLGLTPEYLVDLFEAESASVHTHEYLLHSFGKLTAKGLSRRHPLRRPGRRYGFDRIDRQASARDNSWVCPGRKARSRGNWQARFVDADGIGCRVFVLEEGGSDVVLTDTPYYVSSHGWDDPPADGSMRKMPFLIGRRRSRSVSFLLVHQPFRNGPSRMRVRYENEGLTISTSSFHDRVCLPTMEFEREKL